MRTDNGSEFLLPQFYGSKGIIHQTSCVESPQQNGRVERKHHHILNVGRALLYQSKLPKTFWSYVVSYATYIINRVPTTLLKNQCPYTLLYHKPLDLNQIKVFSSLCFASTLQSHRNKLEPRTQKCVFLGYKAGVKGCVLLDLNSRQIFTSRDVTFHELILPYKEGSHNSSWNYHSAHPAQDDIPTEVHNNLNGSNQICPIGSSESAPTPVQSDSKSPEIEPAPIVHLRKYERTRHRPQHLLEYICSLSTAPLNLSSSSTFYPISSFHSFSKLSPDHSHFSLSIGQYTEPKSFDEASKYACWQQAMKSRIRCLGSK